MSTSRLSRSSALSIKQADIVQLFQVNSLPDSTWLIRVADISSHIDSYLFRTCFNGQGFPMHYNDFKSAERAVLRLRPNLYELDFDVSFALDRETYISTFHRKH